MDTDKELVDVAEYITSFKVTSELALSTARLATIDAIGCGILALNFPECTKHLGPVVPGTVVPNGVHVPGTQHVLDPVQGAWNISCMNRWLDFNDTWLAAEWGHPSDNLGAILSVAEYVSRVNVAEGKPPLTMKDVLVGMVKAYEIQGVMALENSFNAVGLDHVVLVKVASTAVVTQLLGGNKDEVTASVSQAWVDGQSLRTYRHFPNTGPRKSWAAAQAASQAVRLAMVSLKGETGYKTALTAPKWGFYDVSFKGNHFKFQRPYGSYVMENVLFKVSFPAEFHAQTAVECAFKLHPVLKGKLDQVKRVHMWTHLSAIRIIDKKGPLKNEADRDHCLQYMVAIGLIYGDLTADHYEDHIAANPAIDALRDKMIVVENEQYSKDYHDPEKRSIANAVQLEFNDGTLSEKVEVHYPIGHKRRRDEAIPLIIQKLKNNLQTRFPKKQVQRIVDACLDQAKFEAMTVPSFLNLFVI